TILENISAIESIDLYGLNEDGLTITGNTNLATCNIFNICEYLSDSGTNNILNSKTDCYNDSAIEDSCQPISYQSCEGTVYLRTQMEVDYFGVNNPDCTHISGDLFIRGAGINSLSALSNITSVGGHLFVEETILLNSLQGLNSLTSVGGELTLRDNRNLNYIGDLSSIAQVNNLYIINNPSLINIDIFQSLTSIEGYVYISGNDALQNVNGL